ncbi:MAG: PIG-L family deacetylase [Actinomycetota bacterium]
MTGEYGTVLGVWAHPDDETYLSAGLMASAVDAGERVVCVTATRGEEGSFDEERWPSDRMGRIREGELLRCLEILGVTDHRWLDMHDGTLPTEDASSAVDRIFMEPGTPPVTPASDLEIELRLSPDALERKVRAVEQHVSQVEPMTAMLGRRVLFDSQDGEYFRLAARKDPV